MNTEEPEVIPDEDQQPDTLQPDQNGVVNAGLGAAFHNIEVEVVDSEGGEAS